MQPATKFSLCLIGGCALAALVSLAILAGRGGPSPRVPSAEAPPADKQGPAPAYKPAAALPPQQPAQPAPPALPAPNPLASLEGYGMKGVHENKFLGHPAVRDDTNLIKNMRQYMAGMTPEQKRAWVDKQMEWAERRGVSDRERARLRRELLAP